MPHSKKGCTLTWSIQELYINVLNCAVLTLTPGIKIIDLHLGAGGGGHPSSPTQKRMNTNLLYPRVSVMECNELCSDDTLTPGIKDYWIDLANEAKYEHYN